MKKIFLLLIFTLLAAFYSQPVFAGHAPDTEDYYCVSNSNVGHSERYEDTTWNKTGSATLGWFHNDNHEDCSAQNKVCQWTTPPEGSGLTSDAVCVDPESEESSPEQPAAGGDEGTGEEEAGQPEEEAQEEQPETRECKTGWGFIPEVHSSTQGHINNCIPGAQRCEQYTQDGKQWASCIWITQSAPEQPAAGGDEGTGEEEAAQPEEDQGGEEGAEEEKVSREGEEWYCSEDKSALMKNIRFWLDERVNCPENQVCSSEEGAVRCITEAKAEEKKEVSGGDQGDKDERTARWYCQDNKVYREFNDGTSPIHDDPSLNCDNGERNCTEFWNPNAGKWDAWCRQSSECRAVEQSCSGENDTQGKWWCVTGCIDEGKNGCYDSEEAANTPGIGPNNLCKITCGSVPSVTTPPTSAPPVVGRQVPPTGSGVPPVTGSQGSSSTAPAGGTAQAPADCRNNPVAPPAAGTEWVALCNESCKVNSDCEPNVSQPNFIVASTSRWCYGFTGGGRCLQLKHVGTQVAAPGAAPVTTGTGTSTVNCKTGQAPTDNRGYMDAAQASCVLSARGDILPFYVKNGWCEVDANKQAIANDWYFNLATENEKTEITKSCLGGGPVTGGTGTCSIGSQSPAVSLECLSCIKTQYPQVATDIKNLNSAQFSSCNDQELVQYWCNGGVSAGSTNDCNQIKTRAACAQKCGVTGDGTPETPKRTTVSYRFAETASAIETAVWQPYTIGGVTVTHMFSSDAVPGATKFIFAQFKDDQGTIINANPYPAQIQIHKEESDSAGNMIVNCNVSKTRVGLNEDVTFYGVTNLPDSDTGRYVYSWNVDMNHQLSNNKPTAEVTKSFSTAGEKQVTLSVAYGSKSANSNCPRITVAGTASGGTGTGCTANAFDTNRCARCASDGSRWGTNGSDYGPTNGSADWCSCARRYASDYSTSASYDACKTGTTCTPNSFDANRCARCSADGRSWGTNGSDYGTTTGSTEWCACAIKHSGNDFAESKGCTVSRPAPTTEVEKCKLSCGDCKTTTTCGIKTYDTCTDNKGQTGSSLCANGATNFRCQASSNANCASNAAGVYNYSCTSCTVYDG